MFSVNTFGWMFLRAKGSWCPQTERSCSSNRTVSVSPVNERNMEGRKQKRQQKKLQCLGLIKRHINTSSSLFLSSVVPAGSRSMWACSSRNWTAEYFPRPSPPSCYFPLSQHLWISLSVSTELTGFQLVSAEQRWEGLRAGMWRVQTSSQTELQTRHKHLKWTHFWWIWPLMQS